MRWSLKTLLRSFQRGRIRTNRNRRNRSRPGLEILEVRINPSNVDVLTWHNDNTLSGLNNQETILTPANVNAGSFGKLFSYSVDGYVYAQPLYKANLVIGGGVHNVAFVATEGDSVYAFDTDSNTAGPGGNGLYWHTTLLPTRPGFTVTTVPSADTGSGDVVPQVGITGTPLVDAARNTLYVLAKTKEVENATGTPHYVYRLYALNLGTGAVQNSVVVGDTINTGDTLVAENTTNIVVTGANTGRPGDTNGPTGPGAQNGEFRFNARRENQRGAIVEAPPDPLHPDGLLYLDFASHGDNGNYRGWVIGYDPTDLSLRQQFLTTLDDRAVGIWQSGAPVVVEPRPDGSGFNDLFFSTGNGFGVTAGQVGGRNLTESVARIGTDTNPASPSYGQLIYEDSFTPYNWSALDGGDTDLGSGGTMALPDSAGSPQHRHLLVETGKQGRIYLLDRDMLGGLSPDLATEQAAVVQEVDTQITGVWGSPAFFNGRIYYHGSGDVLVSLPVANAHIDAGGIQRTNFRYNFPGAQPSISADGTGNGIVWELQTDNYNDTTAHEVLRAFDANNLQTLLYASNQTGARDQLSNSVKFVVPTISNGHVLVGSAGQFSVFGLFPAPDTRVPDAPTNLAATANSPSQITLIWDTLPLTGGGEVRQLDVERSADGVNFTPIAVVARDSTGYVDTGLTSGTHYFYRIRAENSLGASGYSNRADAATLLGPAVVSVLNVLGTEVDLTWTSVPTADLGYAVQRSTNGGQTWQTDGYVSAGGTFFADAGLNHQAYQFRVLAFAGSGQTSTSNVVSADLSLGATGVDFGNGFNNAAGLTFNGSAARVVNPGWAQLTDGGQNETSTIFTTARVGVSTFQTSFTYRMHDGTDPRSDGMTFIIQGNGPTAVGPGGGGLAYGPDQPTGGIGIPNSVAIKFDLFNNAGEGINSTGIFTGGRSPTVRQPGLALSFPDMSVNLSAAPYLDASGNPIININDQHLKQVDLSYDGTTLTEKITDLQADPLPDGSQPSVTIRYTVDIPTLVGGATAFVGFGGATGGTTVVQEVRTWTYTGTASRVATPNNLAATPRTYSTTGFVKLTWSELSPVVTGFQIERSTDQTNWTRLNGGADLPFNDTTHFDTPPQPGTYYYRVRAVSDLGVSNFTATGPIAVLVPVAPSGLVAQQATPTQITLHWVNNDVAQSATGILVERSDGDASHFVPVATLAPSATSYTDNAVTAPNTYFYRVVAVGDLGSSLYTAVVNVRLQFVVEPVAYWQFDETAGTVAADASGNGNTGTLVGLADGTIEHVAGRFGGGLHFEDHLPDGTVLATGDARLPVVTVPDSPSLNPTNAITLEAWINADTWGGTTSNNHRILQKGLNDNQYRLTDENGALKFDLYINGSLRDVQTDLPSTGVWHHVVGTYDGTAMKLYIDNVLAGQLAISGPIAVTTDPLRIGSKDVGGTAGNHFVGTLDEVRIYDRALTADEIAFQQTWVDQDIGNLSPAGSVDVSGGVYTVRAAGAQIGGTADEFHFAYQALHGDGSITARVVSIDGRDPLTEAGLMIRETLAPDARNVALGLTPSGLDFQYRPDTGGDTSSTPVSAVTAPYWIRLVRQGDVFTAFESADGANWLQVGDAVTVAMSGDVYIGLGLTGHNAGHSDSVLATAVFDNVSVS